MRIVAKSKRIPSFVISETVQRAYHGKIKFNCPECRESLTIYHKLLEEGNDGKARWRGVCPNCQHSIMFEMKRY